MGTKNVPTMILDIAIFVGIFCPYNVGFTRSPTHFTCKRVFTLYFQPIVILRFVNKVTRQLASNTHLELSDC